MPPSTTELCEIVLQLFEAQQAGRVEELVSLLAPDFEATGRVDGRRYVGLDAVRKHFAEQAAGPGRTEVSISRVREDGDRVLAIGRVRVFGPAGMVDDPAVWVVRFRDGKVTRIDGYGTLAEVEAADGSVNGGRESG